MNELRFSIATQEHAKAIEQFMMDEFRIREPITASLQATESDLIDFFHDLSQSGYSSEKYSTVVHQGDRLVALCLCSVTCCDGDDNCCSLPDPEFHDYANEIAQGPYSQHKANQLMTYVSALERRRRELLGNTKVMKIDIICVGDEVKRKMTIRAIELAKEERCEWVATAATAAASQAVFSKMGFLPLYEIPFTSFRENGNVVFKGLYDGCKAGKFMALRLCDYLNPDVTTAV